MVKVILSILTNEGNRLLLFSKAIKLAFTKNVVF